jgi:hypothetical protein
MSEQEPHSERPLAKTLLEGATQKQLLVMRERDGTQAFLVSYGFLLIGG